MAVLCTALGVTAAVLLPGRGYKTKLLKYLGLNRAAPAAVKVMMIDPESGETDVPRDVAPILGLRTDADAIDPKSLSRNALRLIRVADQRVFPAEITAVDQHKIRLRPLEALQPATSYAILVAPGLRTASGVPLQPHLSSFTTAHEGKSAIRFEKVELPNTSGRGCTALTMGPDGKLYAGCDDGTIIRYAMRENGTLHEEMVIDALPRHAGQPRLLIGLVFHPRSTPQNPVAWVTHNLCVFENAEDFTGQVSRMSGADLQDVRDVVVGLPRSTGDHATNQPAFGPDSALYIPQPSNTAFGAPDAFWGMRPERLLSASVLRLDLSKLPENQPLDVRTTDAGGSYDPFASDAPLTIYATGVRLAYELLWHSNGRLYAPTNGASSGGNTPALPDGQAVSGVVLAEDDWLHRVQRGGYHGHPNPAQGKLVLNGGNPSDDYDFAEMPLYATGTAPDRDYVRPVYVFGQHASANGVIEYRSNRFDGALKGRLMVCRYSRGQDIITLTLDSDGNVVDDEFGIPGLSGFKNPLDLVEDPRNGNIYVSDYGLRQIVLCRPVDTNR